MRLLVFNYQVGSRSSTMNVASRNAIELARLLGADRMVMQGDRAQGPYDAVLATYFNRYTNYPVLNTFIGPSTAKVLMRTEYESVVSAGKFKKPLEICNFDNDKGPNVNLNLLISRNPNKTINKRHGVVYYGRYRPDRVADLSKYSAHLDAFSTSKKNISKWKAEGVNSRFVDALDWTQGRETLNLFRYSLYCEDRYTNRVFNNLANRWYEAGICNCVILFDERCVNTIRKSELGEVGKQVQPYIVTDGEDMRRKMEDMDRDWHRHLAIQQSWHAKEPSLKSAMITQVRQIIADEVERVKSCVTSES